MSNPRPQPEPSAPFWDGHQRSPELTEALVQAFREALYAHPALRAGQLLGQVVHRESTTIFNLYDEHLLDALRESAHKV